MSTAAGVPSGNLYSSGIESRVVAPEGVDVMTLCRTLYERGQQAHRGSHTDIVWRDVILAAGR